jgi:hypothetical protein
MAAGSIFIIVLVLIVVVAIGLMVLVIGTGLEAREGGRGRRRGRRRPRCLRADSPQNAVSSPRRSDRASPHEPSERASANKT